MFRKLNARLENLFDQKSQNIRHAIPADNPKINPGSFQIESNLHGLENLSYVFSNDIDAKNLSNLFSQLSSYFEIGLLLQRNSGTEKHRLKDIFAYSKKVIVPETTKPIQLPEVTIYRTLKTRARSFLTVFGLAHYDRHDNMNAYVIAISESHTIVVVTPIAEPWARLRVETLQQTLMRIHFQL